MDSIKDNTRIDSIYIPRGKLHIYQSYKSQLSYNLRIEKDNKFGN